MGVNLHRIGTGISSGGSHNGFGSIVSFPSEPPSFPPAGSYNSTLYGVSYPVGSGGGFIYYNSTYYESQTCDVQVLNDGTGGTYTNFGSATNVQYKSYGTGITSYNYDSTVYVNGTNYSNGSFTTNAYHDGSGGYYDQTSGSFASYGGLITSDNFSGSNFISTPVGDYTYESWTHTSYYHDGYGSYFSQKEGYNQSSSGSHIGTSYASGNLSTEVPSGSGNYYDYAGYSQIDYYYGSTSYYVSYMYTWQYSYGSYITSDGSYSYYWDGNGGYYY